MVLFIVAGLWLLTSCGHSHAKAVQAQSVPAVYVTPHLQKAQRAVARYVLGNVSRSALQRTECHRYGSSALNCFVDLEGGCNVVGVRETRSGEIRFSHPFGYYICSTVGQSG
jgi:hypothetical protein